MTEKLITEYTKVVIKIKEYLISELKERYPNIIFTDEYSYYLIAFTISNIYYEVSLHNFVINIAVKSDKDFNYLDDSDVESVEEFFDYISNSLKLVNKEIINS